MAGRLAQGMGLRVKQIVGDYLKSNPRDAGSSALRSALWFPAKFTVLPVATTLAADFSTRSRRDMDMPDSNSMQVMENGFKNLAADLGITGAVGGTLGELGLAAKRKIQHNPAPITRGNRMGAALKGSGAAIGASLLMDAFMNAANRS